MMDVLERLVTVNHCGLPPWIIASAEFNVDPGQLHIAGVRESSRNLFEKLDACSCSVERGKIFHDFLDVKFALHQWESYGGKARSSLRNSYVRFLRGWGMESNGIEGAVLKSWVCSRFGVYPTYHKGVLNYVNKEEDPRFAYDRMKGSAKSNAIYSQFDLLFEYCQYEMKRRWEGRPCLELFRGTNDPEEHPVLEVRSKRERCVRLNNLVSFTSDREKAWEFGSTVWKATIARSKVFFFSGLLSDSLLRGEDEYMVIGGNYWVKELLY